MSSGQQWNSIVYGKPWVFLPCRSRQQRNNLVEVYGKNQAGRAKAKPLEFLLFTYKVFFTTEIINCLAGHVHMWDKKLDASHNMSYDS